MDNACNCDCLDAFDLSGVTWEFVIVKDADAVRLDLECEFSDSKIDHAPKQLDWDHVAPPLVPGR